MRIVDGHSHMYQSHMAVSSLKTGVRDIEGFDAGLLARRLDDNGVSILQTMPQEMTRIQRQWLGSNALSADIQAALPERVVAYAAAEPLDPQGAFNRARLGEVEQAVTEKGLQGLLLTPPYGHYYANDRQVYPFYEKAVEWGIPIYFHHSHMFGSPAQCPLKYARIYLLDDVVIDFPDLRFNVEHMGYPWTEELLAIMARSPNVYTDIAQFADPGTAGRRRLLARNLGMAREYSVLDRVFYGTDYVGEDLGEYVTVLQGEMSYITGGLSDDMERMGYPPLTEAEMEGLLSTNVLKLWGRPGRYAGVSIR